VTPVEYALMTTLIGVCIGHPFEAIVDLIDHNDDHTLDCVEQLLELVPPEGWGETVTAARALDALEVIRAARERKAG